MNVGGGEFMDLLKGDGVGGFVSGGRTVATIEDVLLRTVDGLFKSIAGLLTTPLDEVLSFSLSSDVSEVASNVMTLFLVSALRTARTNPPHTPHNH